MLDQDEKLATLRKVEIAVDVLRQQLVLYRYTIEEYGTYIWPNHWHVNPDKNGLNTCSALDVSDEQLELWREKDLQIARAAEKNVKSAHDNLNDLMQKLCELELPEKS